jgi:nicotinate-nucleotide adenylyltransferase
MPTPAPDTLVLVFGGSFDPPTLAHVELPDAARRSLHAHEVWYIPAGLQPHKLQHPAALARHRLAMLRLALDGLDWARVLEDELERARLEPRAPTYTFDTLRALRARTPPHVRLRLLIGSDQLEAFTRWRDPAGVVALAEPVVLLRPPATREEVLATLPEGLDAREWAPRLLMGPGLAISSTQARLHARAGLPLNGLVAPAVERYIQSQGLYRGPDSNPDPPLADPSQGPSL